MKRIFDKPTFLCCLLSSLCGLAYADEYLLTDTYRVELPGLVQLVNKTTMCRVIGEVHMRASKGKVVDAYEVVAKREVCADGVQREIHLRGPLKPSLEGRVSAGTVIELAPAK